MNLQELTNLKEFSDMKMTRFAESNVKPTLPTQNLHDWDDIIAEINSIVMALP